MFKDFILNKFALVCRPFGSANLLSLSLRIKKEKIGSSNGKINKRRNAPAVRRPINKQLFQSEEGANSFRFFALALLMFKKVMYGVVKKEL